MKKIFVLFTLLVVCSILIVGCKRKEYPFPERLALKSRPAKTVPARTINTPNQTYKQEYKEEVRFGRVQDMIVFKNELYFMITDTSLGTSDAAIFKYVDEKTPPILQLARHFMNREPYISGNETKEHFYNRSESRFKDKFVDLISFEIYNGQLFAGGPLGIFRLNEPKGTWDHVEFGYAFNYLPQYGMYVGSIKAARGQLYAILNYRTRLKNLYNEKWTERNVTSLVVLAGNAWQLVKEPTYGRIGPGETDFWGADELEFLNGQFVAAKDSSVIILKEESDKKYWVTISNDPDWGLSRFTKIEVYKNKLYACGEDKSTEKGLIVGGRVYVLNSIYQDKNDTLRGDWVESLDTKRDPEFIKVVDGHLYVGTRFYGFGADHLKYQIGIDKVKPLYRFDGSRWESINLRGVPGLDEKQIIDGVTSAIYFNGKIFLAVTTTPGIHKSYPNFFILEGNKLRPVTWMKSYKP